jgi:hypothetical protein
MSSLYLWPYGPDAWAARAAAHVLRVVQYGSFFLFFSQIWSVSIFVDHDRLNRVSATPNSTMATCYM